MLESLNSRLQSNVEEAESNNRKTRVPGPTLDTSHQVLETAFQDAGLEAETGYGPRGSSSSSLLSLQDQKVLEPQVE